MPRLRLLARPLPGMLVLASQPSVDERGAFTRLFCRRELGDLGLARDVEQANLSHSTAEGTLRGLHYQLGTSAETKIVTCVAGRAWDVVLDLRRDSPTFGQTVAVELTPENRKLVVVPEGCAHGFLTLESETTLIYFASAGWDPVRERGVRWDDPAFAIPWPIPPRVVSERDAAHPDFDPGFHLAA